MQDIYFSFTLAVLFLTAIGGYLVRAVFHGRAKNGRIDAYGGSLFVGKRFLEFGMWALKPVVSLLARLRVTPNQVTFFALVPAVGAGIAAALGSFGLAACLATLAGLSDSVDGALARQLEQVSDAGEALDSTLDRYAEFSFIGGLVIYFRFSSLLCMIALLALLGAFMVSYSTAKAEVLRVIPPRGVMRRAERAIYLTFATMLTPFSSALAGPTASLYLRQGPILAALLLVAIAANYSAIRRLAAIVRMVTEREMASFRPLIFKEGASIPSLNVEEIIDSTASLPSAEVRG
jgi:CDP-diacylglycerol--glycerol-3-phosphate 3-phosphatidyltransferase